MIKSYSYIVMLTILLVSFRNGTAQPIYKFRPNLLFAYLFSSSVLHIFSGRKDCIMQRERGDKLTKIGE